MQLYSYEIISSISSLKVEGEIEAFSFEEATQELRKAYDHLYKQDTPICMLNEILLTPEEIDEYDYLNLIE